MGFFSLYKGMKIGENVLFQQFVKINFLDLFYNFVANHCYNIAN